MADAGCEQASITCLERETPAMRAAATTVEASFDAMGLCTTAGAAVVSNRSYDELAMRIGPQMLAELAGRAIAARGETMTISLPETIRCRATPIDFGGPAPTFVVAFHDERPSYEPALSKAAVREVQHNLRQALQLLSISLEVADTHASPANALTSKEEEVLTALMAGYRVPTIARDLHVSQSTVRSHLRSIFQKYGVHSQASLFEKLLATSRAS
jgi:DNA-binding CsgD family transcriptional regulator